MHLDKILSKLNYKGFKFKHAKSAEKQSKSHLRDADLKELDVSKVPLKRPRGDKNRNDGKASTSGANAEKASKMTSQTHGIQQLLTAEKRAAEKVGEARKRKAKRIKQAREEAQAEIEKYRTERDKQFREYEAKYMGSREDVMARINKNTEAHLEQMSQEMEKNKEKVILELLSLTCDVKPEVHRNYFVVNRRPSE